MFLRPAAKCPRSIGTNSPVVSGGVSPLKNALRTFQVFRKLELDGDHDAVSRWDVIPALGESRPHQKHVLLEAGLSRIFFDVVVGAKLELEESSMIGGDFYLGLDFLSGFVLLDDDPVRIFTAWGFVFAGFCVPRVSANSTFSLHRTVLVSEASAEPGRVVVVRRVVESLPPHRRTRDGSDQPAVAGCLIDNHQPDEGEEAQTK